MGVNMERPNIEQMITFIYVSDLNDSKRFYEEIMGFPLRLDQGTCRIVETNQKSGGLLGYCDRDQKSAPVGNLIITLVTSSVDEWYDYLTGCGVNIPEPPKLNLNYKIYHFFFTDPDGYKLEIQEFRDPAW
jgi:catechol 2,3-dioxygenase-like lactoylglutathione lyase family enzyme